MKALTGKMFDAKTKKVFQQMDHVGRGLLLE